MKNILLIGIGRYGEHIAKELSKLEVDVMAIDREEENLRKVEDYVTKALIGNCSDIDFLKTLDIDSFDEVIVSIGNDFQSSIEAVLNLKELGAKRITARASLESQEKLLSKIGADEVVYPEKQLGKWTALHCGANSVFDYMDLDDGYAIIEIAVPEKWVDKSIIELDLRKKYNVNIIGIKNNTRISFNFNSSYKLSEKQSLLVVGKQEDIEKCIDI